MLHTYIIAAFSGAGLIDSSLMAEPAAETPRHLCGPVSAHYYIHYPARHYDYLDYRLAGDVFLCLLC